MTKGRKNLMNATISALLVCCASVAHAQQTEPRFVSTGDVVRTEGVQQISDMKSFASPISNQRDLLNSPISIRERGYAGAGTGANREAPNINFHWSNRASNSLWMNAAGELNYGQYNTAGNPSSLSTFNAGRIRANGQLEMYNQSPTIFFHESDAERSAMLHVNGSHFYILRGCDGDGLNWCTTNGRWPFVINLSNNDASFGGAVRAIAYLHHSDERLKENITDLDTSVVREKLRQVRSVSYNAKDTGAGSMGFIAQELQKIFPDMVRADKDGMLSVEYTQLISPMLATMVEIEDELAAEKEKNAALALAIGSLEERLAAIEAAVK